MICLHPIPLLTVLSLPWLGAAPAAPTTEPVISSAEAETSGAPRVWTDLRSGTLVAMRDLWTSDRKRPRNIQKHPHIGPLLRLASASAARGPFEGLDDFERRKQEANATLQAALSQPMSLVGAKVADNTYQSSGFTYDPDRQLLRAMLDQKDRIVGLSSEQVSLNFSTTVSYCDFSVSAKEVIAHLPYLSVVYDVRPGALSSGRITARGGIELHGNTDAIDLWLIDRAAFQRLGVVPLSHCDGRMDRN